MSADVRQLRDTEYPFVVRCSKLRVRRKGEFADEHKNLSWETINWNLVVLVGSY